MYSHRNEIALHQRQALDFMLDAIGLQSATDEAYRAAHLLELEERVAALLSENHRLRLRVAQFEREPNPDEAELDALERAIDTRSPVSGSVALITSDPVWPSGDMTEKGGQV